MLAWWKRSNLWDRYVQNTNNVNDKISNSSKEKTSITMSIVKLDGGTAESHGETRRQHLHLKLHSGQLRNGKRVGAHGHLHHLRNGGDFGFLERIPGNRRGGVDRTPTHNTHLCSTVCSQARNAHHALGSRASTAQVITDGISSIPNRGSHLKNSSRMDPTPSVLSSRAHWVTWPQLRCAILATSDVTLRDVGKKCRGSTSFLLGALAGTTLSAKTETFGEQKTGCQDASEFRENTVRYHAFQTAGQWVRGELRNMQVAGQDNNDENRPTLITNWSWSCRSRSQGCVVVLLWCCGWHWQWRARVRPSNRCRKLLSDKPPISLALLRPRCWRQRYRAKALRIQERWPSVDVVQLEVVKGVTPCLPTAKIPALWRSIGLHIRLHLHVDVGVHARSGSRHGEKNSTKKREIAIRLRRDPTMVCSYQCDLCGGACCWFSEKQTCMSRKIKT